jgi:uncharacterized membrane protein (DUF485 family)
MRAGETTDMDASLDNWKCKYHMTNNPHCSGCEITPRRLVRRFLLRVGTFVGATLLIGLVVWFIWEFVVVAARGLGMLRAALAAGDPVTVGVVVGIIALLTVASIFAAVRTWPDIGRMKRQRDEAVLRALGEEE